MSSSSSSSLVKKDQPAAAANAKGKAFWPNIDGLRGVGVIIVILYHMGYRVARQGWICISIFFVLSGFFITGMTVKAYDVTGRIDIPQFWSRRVGRLFPALFVLIILLSLSRFVRVEDQAQLALEKQDLAWSCSFLLNYYMIFFRNDDYFTAYVKPSLTRHLWTLSIEEQYYLIWPLVFYVWTVLFARIRKRREEQEADADAALENSLELAPESSYRQVMNVKDRDNNRSISNTTQVGKMNPGDKTFDSENLLKAESTNTASQQQLRRKGVATSAFLPEKLFRHSQMVTKSEPQDPNRPFLLALCVGECVVIAISYFSSLETMYSIGISGAYYSTWSRMGDMACGGLAFLVVRLQPKIYARVSQAPGLKPMTTKFRILLEVCWFLALCMTVLPPMIDAPLEDLHTLYFTYVRMPFNLLIATFVTAGVVQISEPLPRWAIFSRALSSKFLMLLGIISYGIYLYHWPIILFFGTPVDHSKFEAAEADEEEQNDGVSRQPSVIRDVAIVVFTVVYSFVCFFLFEKPLLIRARKSNPWQVIRYGLGAAALTASFVIMCYWDVKTVITDNDADEIFGNLELEQNSTSAVVLAMASTLLLDRPSTITPAGIDVPLLDLDERFTPIYLFVGSKKKPDARLVNYLDEYTIPTDSQRLPCTGNDVRERERDSAIKCQKVANTNFHEMQAAVTPANSVIVMCKTFSNNSPCDVGNWKSGVKWIWLESKVLCGTRDFFNQTAYDTTCPDRVSIDSVAMAGEKPSTEYNWCYTDSHHLDNMYLMELVLHAANAFPGSINRKALDRVENLLQVATVKEYETQKKNFIKHDISWSNQLKVLILGESIAARIAILSKELLESSTYCASKKLETLSFPEVKLLDLSHRGKPALNFFPGCQLLINQTEDVKAENRYCGKRSSLRSRVKQAIPRTEPDVIIVKDSYWHEVGPIAGVSMKLFVKQAILTKVKHIFFLTHVTMSHSNSEVQGMSKELSILEAFLAENRCGDNEDESAGIKFSVVDWRRLVCPTYTHDLEFCPNKAHGFPLILPDGFHPSGPSGEWLTAQALSVIFSQSALDLGWPVYTNWETASRNPISACLLETNKPNNNPPLKDLIQTYRVCPKHDPSLFFTDQNSVAV